MNKDIIICAAALAFVATGAVAQQVRVFNTFDASYQGGVNVAAGDVNGDGRTDSITGADTGASAGGAPHVRVFDGSSTGFQGGVRVATGDVNGATDADANSDGGDDIIVGSGPGGSPATPQGAGTVRSGETSEPVGLLLPAVQKAREAARR